MISPLFLDYHRTSKMAKAIAYCAIFLLVLSPIVRAQTSVGVPLRRFSNLFYHEVSEANPGKSVIMSGCSLYMLLGLLTMGAEGDTLTEMLDVTYMDDQDDTRTTHGELIDTLTSWQSVIMQIANKVYVMDGFVIGENFATDAVDVFKSEVEAINFKENVAASNTINKWVEDKTNKTIKNLMNPGMLDKLTRLVLVNAIYFKADWEKPFPKFKTEANQNFNLLNGKTKKVSMMNQNGNFLYGTIQSLDAKVVELFYKNREFSMVFILPNKKTGLTAIENKLQSSTNWKKLLRGLKSEYIGLSIPMFKTETDINLMKILPNLGLELMFDPERSQLNPLLEDFDDILYVTQAKQKAFIEVNERGTTAAAATVIGISTIVSVVSSPKISFIADRPFMYQIRDKLGNILFMGCYKG